MEQSARLSISVVIPTGNRKARMLALLNNLNLSTYPLSEIIIVDSGEDRLNEADFVPFSNWPIRYLGSEKSVCLQRNTGIRQAAGDWIFLCDDDIEVPPDYLQKLAGQIQARPETGALSGLFLQMEQGVWTAEYPLRSAGTLIWTFIFRQGLWGRIDINSNSPLVQGLIAWYRRKGNHISKAGWPVLTQFSRSPGHTDAGSSDQTGFGSSDQADYFTTPLYSLGAALVKREWLLAAPFDEVLDRYGMGDNYGVCAELPMDGLTVLNNAFVYHHKEPANRLVRPLQYFRRVLALDYFIGTREKIRYANRSWLLWSLIGNLLSFIRGKDRPMMQSAFRAIWLIATRRNPYKRAARAGEKVLEPTLTQPLSPEMPAATNPPVKAKRPPTTNPPVDKPILLWLVFFIYMALLAYASIHHELWGDEVHSWNISKGSGSYFDLLHNRRYEGHPPAWYTLLWIISRFTHQVIYMQVLQYLIAAGVVYLVLLKSPFSTSTRILLPFGYYFLFEYGALSRNYALGVLLACWICLIIRKESRHKLILYYGLLFCLSNVHLLALFLAISLHGYFLLLRRNHPSHLILHLIAGIMILLPAAWFIHTPADSEINVGAWTQSWNPRQLGSFYQPVLRAFLPLPAWWKYNFWNTEFLLDGKNFHPLLTVINPLVSIFLLVYIFYIFRKSPKTAALLAVNLLFSYCLSVTAWGLTTARYAGFLYIGFIVAYWLYCYERPGTVNDAGNGDERSSNDPHNNTLESGGPAGQIWKHDGSWIESFRSGTPRTHPGHMDAWRKEVRLVNALLIVQLAAAAFAVTRDMQLPFSNMYTVTDVLGKVPPGERIVTDYWTMNAVVAFTDKPVYCLDVQKELSFILWDSNLKIAMNNPHRYTDGLSHYFEQNGIKTAWLISMSSPHLLAAVDPLLNKTWRLTLVESREGAIERGSNVYLYRVEKQPIN